MSIRERWISLLHRTATGTKKTRTLLTPVGVTVFAVFTAVFVVAALQVDRLIGLPELLPGHLRGPVGVSVL